MQSAALELALIWMLFWHYLLVAWFFWRGASRTTLGVLFTTASFVAWASVFPVAYVVNRWLPGLHIPNESWNLPKFLVATGMIFTVLEEQLGEAKHDAMHDALTGLPNRRLFARRLDAALVRARERRGRVAVLVIPAPPLMKTPEALQVWGPRGFGYDFPYRPPSVAARVAK